MIAISAMAMFCLAAIFPVQIVGEYDKNGGGNDQPNYIGGKKMLYC
jgi:hypothetical protein